MYAAVGIVATDASADVGMVCRIGATISDRQEVFQQGGWVCGFPLGGSPWGGFLSGRQTPGWLIPDGKTSGRLAPVGQSPDW